MTRRRLSYYGRRQSPAMRSKRARSTGRHAGSPEEPRAVERARGSPVDRRVAARLAWIGAVERLSVGAQDPSLVVVPGEPRALRARERRRSSRCI